MIAEFADRYSRITGDDGRRRFGVIGLLYNDYGPLELECALGQLELRIALGDSIREPLRYLIAILRRGRHHAAARQRETPVDRMLREAGVYVDSG